MTRNIKRTTGTHLVGTVDLLPLPTPEYGVRHTDHLRGKGGKQVVVKQHLKKRMQHALRHNKELPEGSQINKNAPMNTPALLQPQLAPWFRLTW